MIPLNKPVYTKEMEKAALEALHNESYVLGESVYKFEEEFAKYIGVDHAVACSSGTMAFWLILQCLPKIKRVIIPANTFHTVASVVEYSHKQLLMQDVNLEDACLYDQKLVMERKSTVVATHLYGNFCDINYNEYGVIEDASQAAGLEARGRKVGSFGYAGFFSLYTTKNLSCLGDGGIITTNEEKLAALSRSIGNCGRDQYGNHIHMGITSRLNNVNASIARVQLRYLDRWNEKRMKLRDYYAKHLPPTKILSHGVVYQMVLRLKNQKTRDYYRERLAFHNIQTGIHYPEPIHHQKPFYRKNEHYPVAEILSQTILSLPMSPLLTFKEVKKVCDVMQEVSNDEPI